MAHLPCFFPPGPLNAGKSLGCVAAQAYLASIILQGAGLEVIRIDNGFNGPICWPGRELARLAFSSLWDNTQNH